MPKLIRMSLRLLLAVLYIFFLPGQLFAATTMVKQTSQSNNSGIENLIQSTGNNINIGIKVQDVKTGKIIFSKNSDRTFVPASNLKLFTAFVGLYYLGPDFRFKTQILTNNKTIKDGQLDGNLYFRFTGDPDLSVADLKQMIVKLKQMGIHRINGNVYIDDSAYGPASMGPGWMWDDADRCFSAPISANILNQNCVDIKIKPGAKPGVPLHVKSYTANEFITLKNKTTTKPEKYKKCSVRLKAKSDNEYILSGCLPVGASARTLSISLQDPDDFVSSALGKLLYKNGVQVGGEVIEAKNFQHLTLLVEHKSAKLTDLVNTMLKESDNLISDSLFKKIGARYYHAPGTWKNGSKALKTILSGQLAVDMNNSVLADGSGLSRYNLVTPNQIVSLLNTAYHKPVANQFIHSLPVAGVDGTLKYRMRAPGLANKIKAKTGTMASVTALSGYIYTSRNHVLAFSILINGIAGSMHKYIQLEDQICNYLYNTE